MIRLVDDSVRLALTRVPLVRLSRLEEYRPSTACTKRVSLTRKIKVGWKSTAPVQLVLNELVWLTRLKSVEKVPHVHRSRVRTSFVRSSFDWNPRGLATPISHALPLFPLGIDTVKEDTMVASMQMLNSLTCSLRSCRCLTLTWPLQSFSCFACWH